MTGNALSTEQFAELSGTISKQLWPAIKDRMDSATAQEFIENPDKVLRALREGFLPDEKLLELPVVRSNGRTGAEWISVLCDAGVYLISYAKDLLSQDEFDREHVTDGCEYDIEMISGSEFSDDERTTENIRRIGTKERGLIEPPAEVATLLALTLTVEKFKCIEQEYGIRNLVVVHDSISDSDGYPRLLRLRRHGKYLTLDASWGFSAERWVSRDGFVFLTCT